MTEEQTKTFFDNLSSLFVQEAVTPPCGGLLRIRCPKCGGTVHEGVGRGILRDVCGSCGEIYHEPVFRME